MRDNGKAGAWEGGAEATNEGMTRHYPAQLKWRTIWGVLFRFSCSRLGRKKIPGSGGKEKEKGIWKNLKV